MSKKLAKLANSQGLHNERHQEAASQAGGGCRRMKGTDDNIKKIEINKFKETNPNAKMKRSFDLHCTILQSQCKWELLLGI